LENDKEKPYEKSSDSGHPYAVIRACRMRSHEFTRRRSDDTAGYRQHRRASGVNLFQ
jgi:hypothetical protein